MKAKPRKQFNTIEASLDLIEAMEDAIRNMTQELKKSPDQDLSGSARRAELASYKETALACKELILERQRMIEFTDDFKEKGSLNKDAGDYKGGFAERHAQ